MDVQINGMTDRQMDSKLLFCTLPEQVGQKIKLLCYLFLRSTDFVSSRLGHDHFAYGPVLVFHGGIWDLIELIPDYCCLLTSLFYKKYRNLNTVKLQWLKHHWDHEN